MMIALAAALVLGPTELVRSLAYRPAPVDNPLKGLVPYAGEHRAQFPHSMEFGYLALKDLMLGRGRFDWTKLEALLRDVAGRGHHTIFRVWVEYPGSPSGLPEFLRTEGVAVTTYPGEGATPNFTPDYRDPKLQSALAEFIAALGKRYDGDPRVGYVTAGLLGHWGEWHTYPRNDLSPTPELEAKVMDAYTRAFRRTPVLLRYPTAANRDRPFGYHDDSFAWATLETGRAEDGWFYMPALRRAEATDKWKRYPIGGEIRPEAWGKVFDSAPGDMRIQDFRACVDQAHATWLMDSGMFADGISAERVARATREVGRMGYEFTITKARTTATTLEVTVTNRGVAPFYADWPVELRAAGRKTWRPGWRLTGILPGASVVWKTRRPTGAVWVGVPNPMPKGHPVRFANVDEAGWVRLTP